MKIIFTRHGESQANLLHEISNRGLRHPLTARGRQQAHALGQKLAHEQTQGQLSIGRIYSSPLLRAIETSVTLAHHLNVDYEVTGALREFDCGIAEGRSDEAAWKLWGWAVESWAQCQAWDERIAEGESFNDLRARFVPFIQGLIESEGQQDIVCVAHGGLYLLMLPLIFPVSTLEREQALEHFKYTSCLYTEVRAGELVIHKFDTSKDA